MLIRQRANTTCGCDWYEKRGSVCIEDQCRWGDVVDKILEFRFCGVEGQRDGDATRPPDTPLRRNPGKSRRYQKRHALFVKIFLASEQRSGHARRRFQQIAVSVRPLRIDDRSPPCVPLGVNKKRIPTSAADHVQTLRVPRLQSPLAGRTPWSSLGKELCLSDNVGFTNVYF